MVTVPLPPHYATPKVIFACLGALTLAVLLMVAVFAALGLMQRQVDPVMLLVVVGVLVGTFLGTRRLVAGPAMALQFDGASVRLVAGGKDLATAPLADVLVRHGYYDQSGKHGSFRYAAVALELPGAPKLSLGVQDLRATCYWKGDDPWQRIQVQGETLPVATHILAGSAFMHLVREVGLGDRLAMRLW